MARRKRKAPIEEVIDVMSKLPWWICLILALITYLVLHVYASQPLIQPQSPGSTPVSKIYSDAIFKGFITTIATFGQYLFPFVFIVAAIISAVKAQQQKRLYDGVARRSDAGALNDMTWRQFETLIGEFFSRRGFSVVHTPEGPDGGVDLILKKDGEKYLVQCKQWKAYKVGVQPVRELYGVMASTGAVGGFFVTSGEFSEEAQKFAQNSNIQLMDGRQLRSMIGSNAPQKFDKVASSIFPVLPAPTISNAAANCPVCGSDMVRRRARKGNNAGNEFWGCTRYPSCRGIRDVVI